MSACVFNDLFGEVLYSPILMFLVGSPIASPSLSLVNIFVSTSVKPLGFVIYNEACVLDQPIWSILKAHLLALAPLLLCWIKWVDLYVMDINRATCYSSSLEFLSIYKSIVLLGFRKMEEQKPKEQRPKANENKPVMTE